MPTTKIDERAARLRKARADKGFDQATDAARAHGWNENTYRSHENATRGFKFDTAETYATAFAVNIDWLWRGATGKKTITREELAASEMEDLKLLDEDQQDFVLKQLRSLIDGLKGRKFHS